MENVQSMNNKDKIFILETENSKAIFDKFKLISLIFTDNNKKITVLNNEYQEKNFLLDGSYLMFPWVGRITSDDYLKSLNDNLVEKYPFKDSNGFPLHGFLANHPRKVLNQTKNSITFNFEETNFTNILFKHFPEITEKYTLLENKLIIDLEFQNKTDKDLYFNFGYHPYFQFNLESINNLILTSSMINKKWNLHKKYLIPNLLENENFSVEKEDFYFENFLIEKSQFDNLYEIENEMKNNEENKIEYDLINLINKDNKIEIALSIKKPEYVKKEEFILMKFIQIYTPDERDRIAIEPLSGPSNAFNFPNLAYNINISPQQMKHSNFNIEFRKID